MLKVMHIDRHSLVASLMITGLIYTASDFVCNHIVIISCQLLSEGISFKDLQL